MKKLITKNEKKSNWLIWTFSFIVFTLVVALDRVQVNVKLPFDANIFALFNALINSIIAVLLIIGVIAIQQKKVKIHKRLMLTALTLSILFLFSYLLHKIFTGETLFGDFNHDGHLSSDEITKIGSIRRLYLTILISHIILAALILPFVLFTAYRALTGDYERHKRLARITFPIWLYVAITGPIIYWMIAPFY